MIVDGKSQVMGRLSSKVAKKLLDGEEVKVINCEKIVITGNPENSVEKYLQKKEIGDPRHGPGTSLTPENILRDSIKGMLPMDKERGREALRKLDVVQGNIEDKKGKKLSKDTSDLTTNYITLEDLSKRIGGK